MKIKSSKLLSIALLFTLTLGSTGCLDQLLKKTPKCSDENVVQELNKVLNADLVYGTRAEIRKDHILFVGENEQTGMKTCKVTVDYSLKNDSNNSVVSMMNMIPIMSDIAKNKTVTYTVELSQDKKTNVIKVVD
ncbi:MAG: hypothetical protein WC656_06695 [Sulfurimonas sp.]|jgi:hypothetical protein